MFYKATVTIKPDQLVVSGEKSDFNDFEISHGLDDGYVIDVQGGTKPYTYSSNNETTSI